MIVQNVGRIVPDSNTVDGFVGSIIILQQLANLRSQDYIESRLQEGTLHVHAWMRIDQTSAIATYDPVTGQFCE